MRQMRTGQKITQAKNLRKQMTEAEKKLWNRLRDRGICGAKFRRQYPVGPYIGDFACAELGLIIEADGGQHAMNEAYDEIRAQFLQKQGFTVLRFWNNDILFNMEGVFTVIADAIEKSVSGAALTRRFAPPSPVNGRGEKAAL